MTDPPRLPEDPEDTPGNDEHYPDAPTEPPDKAEGTKGRWGMERAETRVPRASRDVKEGPGEVISVGISCISQLLLT
jgi:hypothetical protein